MREPLDGSKAETPSATSAPLCGQGLRARVPGRAAGSRSASSLMAGRAGPSCARPLGAIAPIRAARRPQAPPRALLATREPGLATAAAAYQAGRREDRDRRQKDHRHRQGLDDGEPAFQALHRTVARREGGREPLPLQRRRCHGRGSPGRGDEAPRRSGRSSRLRAPAMRPISMRSRKRWALRAAPNSRTQRQRQARMPVDQQHIEEGERHRCRSGGPPPAAPRRAPGPPATSSSPAAADAGPRPRIRRRRGRQRRIEHRGADARDDPARRCPRSASRAAMARIAMTSGIDDDPARSATRARRLGAERESPRRITSGPAAISRGSGNCEPQERGRIGGHVLGAARRCRSPRGSDRGRTAAPVPTGPGAESPKTCRQGLVFQVRRRGSRSMMSPWIARKAQG